MPGHELHSELAATKRLQRRLISASNRILWRLAVRKRATMVSLILRRLASLVLAERAELARTPEGWGVSVVDGLGGRHPALELVTYSKARSLSDLAQPLPLRVVAADLVATDRVEELARSGMVVLVPQEVT